ncbi:MAG: hypothetical protein LBT21_00690 [Oscillospiraceae bacterium]|jgi:hypothetical protein|nr:hypothetical protein [Oscillospiraceae bacterium]
MSEITGEDEKREYIYSGDHDAAIKEAIASIGDASKWCTIEEVLAEMDECIAGKMVKNAS